MDHPVSNHRYDLEDRTLEFAKDIRIFASIVTKNLQNFDDLKQLIRSSGSVGANYREANEALSKKDFLMRVKISRKEARESIYWLQLVNLDQDIELNEKKRQLINEATELMKIFGAIITKSL